MLPMSNLTSAAFFVDGGNKIRIKKTRKIFLDSPYRFTKGRVYTLGEYTRWKYYVKTLGA